VSRTRYQDDQREIERKMREELTGAMEGDSPGESSNRAQMAIAPAVLRFIATELDRGSSAQDACEAAFDGIASALTSMAISFSNDHIVGAVSMCAAVTQSVAELLIRDANGAGSIISANRRA
jgi:hypothetical protein